MQRRLVLVAIVVFVVAAPLMSVVAQDTPPVATPLATPVADAQLDLAALTLRPSDLERVGLPGFGLANESSLRDAATDAIVQSGGDAIEVTERLQAYREQGFRHRYFGSLLRPEVPLQRLPSGLVAAEQRISSGVAEFATAEGAAAGFATITGPLDAQPGRDVLGTRVFGDESELRHSTGYEIETGDPLQRLELTFRVGNLVADVAIVDFANVKPDIAAIERLGEVLLARVEQATAAGPDLSPRVLRIAPLVPWIEKGRLRDFYVRINGHDEPLFAQIVATLEERTAAAPAATPEPAATPVAAYQPLLPQDTYMFWTPVGEGNPLELPLYVVWIDRYESLQQAAAALQAVTSDLGPGYVNVRELSRITMGFGDESRAFAYRYEGDPGGPVRGHVVMSRVGNLLVRLQVDGPDGIRRAGVVALTERQVACLRAMAACEPIPARDALNELLPGMP